MKVIFEIITPTLTTVNAKSIMTSFKGSNGRKKTQVKQNKSVPKQISTEKINFTILRTKKKRKKKHLKQENSDHNPSQCTRGCVFCVLLGVCFVVVVLFFGGRELSRTKTCFKSRLLSLLSI